MLYQEYYIELDDEWFTTNERLTRFRKNREHILGRFKGAESPYLQGSQYSEEDLVLRGIFSKQEQEAVIQIA